MDDTAGVIERAHEAWKRAREAHSAEAGRYLRFTWDGEPIANSEEVDDAAMARVRALRDAAAVAEDAYFDVLRKQV